MSTEFEEHVEKIENLIHHDPHALLGLHEENGQKKIRLFRPGALQVRIMLFNQLVEMQQITLGGIFEIDVPASTTHNDYKVFHQNGLLAEDPYTFWPTFGEIDQYLFTQGVHYLLYRHLGARVTTHQGVEGVAFSVWAPSARAVSIVADFNYWDGRVNPMRSLGYSGVWEIFIPGIKEGERYKFEIRTQTGELKLKSDPMALRTELRPHNASIVATVDKFRWTDQEWLDRRQYLTLEPQPINIYEVHLGSWRKKDGNFYNYREFATLLGDYVKEMGYTHVELMPIAEHPLDESWGYQVTGYYSVTSRFGTPEDFQFFVNHLHSLGIGVIVDWVSGHFPSDDFSLARFDGTALYEHEDPRQGWHPHWQTYIFNLGRKEVSNFLIANALFWFDMMHVDGLRVDAVASLLYRDYGRENGEWIPNQWGGRENLEAIEFLKHCNSLVTTRFPGVWMIAEESTAFPGVSRPLNVGGLGFQFKWNMGWMNDTLRYISKDPIHRKFHHNDLTFGLIYAFSENFILVLSHDEVVHGKNSLLGRMKGDMWQQFANLRLLISYQMCHPGKKLLFMGCEIGQWNEWNCKSSIEWDLLQFPNHHGIQKMVKAMNHFYLARKELWSDDFTPKGFEWVDYNDWEKSVISFLRKDGSKALLCVHNFTPNYYPNYFLKQAHVSHAKEIFNSDEMDFGGTGKKNSDIRITRNEHGEAVGLELSLAPLATQILEITWQ